MPSEISDDSGPPRWDQEEGDALVGQLLLAGVTYLAADGKTVTSKVQCWGRIVSAKPEGIAIRCEGKVWTGETITLPPDLRAYQAARPGEYKLRSTGEAVENPDLTTSWSITERSDS
jgi:hypothetical protein